MKVTDAGGRIFTCKKGEKARMAIECEGTAFGINHAFDPPVPNKFTDNGNNGVLDFIVEHDTDLIINFNFSEDTGGKYMCALTHIESDSDGIFPETVIQFEILPERRTYTFIVAA